MSVEKRPGSKYWQVRFEHEGVTVKKSAKTTSKREAELYEAKLKADLIEQLARAEREGPQHAWSEATAKFERENGALASWERTARDLAALTEHLTADVWVRRISYTTLLDVQGELQKRLVRGNGWKTKRTWKPETVNRALRVCGWVLNRCASEDWSDDYDESGNRVPWLAKVPTIPQIDVPTFEPPNVNREKVCELLDRFPMHTADASVLALATGLRLSNVTGLRRDRIDRNRCCCWVPGYESKNGDPIPVPLNDDAMEVIGRWEALHAERDAEWLAHWRAHGEPEGEPDPTQYLIVYRCRAPIQRLTTRAWKRECAGVGLPWLTFHKLRHIWASWQAQAGTSTRILQWLGGWKSAQMPARYTHLDASILTPYASNTLLRPAAPAIILPPSYDQAPRPAQTAPGAPAAALSAAVPENQHEGDVTPCFGGKGGTRTLDPGIMRTQHKKKVA